MFVTVLFHLKNVLFKSVKNSVLLEQERGTSVVIKGSVHACVRVYVCRGKGRLLAHQAAFSFTAGFTKG